MNTVQRIAKNTGVLLISQIVSYILGFFFVMYTARYLGAEGFALAFLYWNQDIREEYLCE